jgi:3-oxoacyl-[acyl-carrier-protein] synthase II
MAERVVITSVGIISSLGFYAEEIIANMKRNHVAFEFSSHDQRLLVAPVKEFELASFTGRFKHKRYLHRGAAFAVASALEAVRHAGLDARDLQHAGIYAGVGPNLDFEHEIVQREDGKIAAESLSALWLLKFLPNTAVSTIAQLVGAHGENNTYGSACASSLQAIGEGYRKIKNGYLDCALCGGGDSRLSRGGLLGYQKAQALFQAEEVADMRYSPFDESRKGFVPGEGGAFFVLESLAHAQKRQAPIYAEICGYGSSIDGYTMTAPDPSGYWAEQAVRNALTEADLLPGAINVVSAHATGTKLNDAMEAALLQRLFATEKPYILAYKSWIGHAAAACGALELALGLCAMQAAFLPGIRNLKKPCNPDLHYVYESCEKEYRTMLYENFGFGGQNAALVLRKWN